MVFRSMLEQCLFGALKECTTYSLLFSGEDVFAFGAAFGAEGIARGVEAGKVGGVVEIILNDVGGHHSTGFFGVEADDLVLVVLPVEKIDVDDGATDFLFLDGFEVFVGGEVHKVRVTASFELGVEGVGNDITPEFVEVLTAFVF